jgi:hypothetical protein
MEDCEINGCLLIVKGENVFSLLTKLLILATSLLSWTAVPRYVTFSILLNPLSYPFKPYSSCFPTKAV